MRNCKPQYKYFGDGHVMCETKKCQYAMDFMFVSNRTGEQIKFQGCPELLHLFYLRELWLRTIGMQQLTEETRNIAKDTRDQTNGTAKSIGEIAGVFRQMRKIANDKGEPGSRQIKG